MIRKNKTEVFIFLAIIIIASFFRLYLLDSVPPGLWVDEAMNGTDALEAIDSGNYRSFYPDNNGREGLYINLQAISIKMFGPNPWSLRVVSALAGVLTVAGLYLLVRHLFGYHMAAVSGFLMAVSFWHVNFSRIGFRAILTPLVIVFAFYFLWRGLRHGNFINYALAGIIGGLGFYTYISFRVAPLIAILVFINYWSYLKKDFSRSEYESARNRFLQGFSILFIATIIVALPIGIQFWSDFDQLNTRSAQLSVFGQDNPVKELLISVVETLGMFNLNGDGNQRHNISGEPMLIWPVGILFIIGFIKEAGHWLKRKHGHFSTVHTFLFAWFFTMLLPGFLSLEAPHALRTIGVIPVVMIFAASGLIWLLDKISAWYGIHEPDFYINKERLKHEAHAIKLVTIIVFLAAVGMWNYDKYFNVWANNPHTDSAFTKNLTEISNYINSRDNREPKYIVVNELGVIVDGISIFAQPIKFMTETYTKEMAKQKNIFYINEEDLENIDFPSEYFVIPLKNKISLNDKLIRSGLSEEQYEYFSIYRK